MNNDSDSSIEKVTSWASQLCDNRPVSHMCYVYFDIMRGDSLPIDDKKKAFYSLHRKRVKTGPTKVLKEHS